MNASARLLVTLILSGSLVWLLRLVRLRRLRGKYVLPWLFAVPVLVALVLSPGFLEWVSDRLGVEYPLAAFLLVGLAFALPVLVHTSWELSRLEERNRMLAEELALLRARMFERGDLRVDPGPDVDPAPPGSVSTGDGRDQG